MIRRPPKDVDRFEENEDRNPYRLVAVDEVRHALGKHGVVVGQVSDEGGRVEGDHDGSNPVAVDPFCPGQPTLRGRGRITTRATSLRLRRVLGRKHRGQDALVPQLADVDWPAGPRQATPKRSTVACGQERDDEPAVFDLLDRPIPGAHAEFFANRLFDDELVSLPDDRHCIASRSRYDCAA